MMLRLTAERREDAPRDRPGTQADTRGRTRMLTRRRRAFPKRARMRPRGSAGVSPGGRCRSASCPDGQSGPASGSISHNGSTSARTANHDRIGCIGHRLATAALGRLRFFTHAPPRLHCRRRSARGASPPADAITAGTRPTRWAGCGCARTAPNAARRAHVAGRRRAFCRTRQCMRRRHAKIAGRSRASHGAPSFRFVRSQGLPCRHCSGLV